MAGGAGRGEDGDVGNWDNSRAVNHPGQSGDRTASGDDAPPAARLREALLSSGFARSLRVMELMMPSMRRTALLPASAM